MNRPIVSNISMALTASGLVKRFRTGRNTVEVLKGVDFSARHGQVTMVMGPSGSGKSTLIAALSGLLRPDEGSVSALGEDLWKASAGRIDRFRHLARCADDDARFGGNDNLKFSLSIRGRAAVAVLNQNAGAG